MKPAIPSANKVSDSDEEMRYRTNPEIPIKMMCGNVEGSSKFNTRSVTVGVSGSFSFSSIKHGDGARPVKSDACRATMAKRLTKALRDKRRWLGLEALSCSTKDELEGVIDNVAPSNHWKIVIFENGKAILKVRLIELEDWRDVFASPNTPIRSITTSGKIRLVKERMGLN